MKYLPNILSSIRILLVPVFVAVFFLGGEHGQLWAAGIFLAAAATDFLDGYIARRFKCSSNLGKILDPAGDKLMTLAMVICLAVRRIIPAWIPWFFGVKELLMVCGTLLMSGKQDRQVPPSNLLGKTATFAIFGVGVALMVFPLPSSAANGLILLTVILSLAALISYTVSFSRLIKMRSSSN